MFKRAKVLVWAVPVLFAICSTALCSAQMSDKEKEKGTMKSVTGCLQKGDETGGYYIAGDDGKVWELHSKKVSLAEHVGHTVTVSGAATMESTEDEAKIEANEKKEYAEKEHGDLRVHHLKMVSESCK
jgi:hypothetical protein